MRKNRFFLGSALLMFLFLFFLGCKDKNRQGEKEEMMINNKSADDTSYVSGVFEAILPCADCSGILTRIFLQKDFTYIKEENYKGVADTMPNIFYDLGKWHIKDSTITLSGLISDTFQYRLLPDQTLKMLAQDGTSLPDSIASQYVFRPKGKNFKPMKPILISGVLDKTEGKYSFHICIWDKTVGISFTPFAQKQLDTLWKGLKKPSVTKAILQCETILDTIVDHKLIVQKINTLIPGDNCN